MNFFAKSSTAIVLALALAHTGVSYANPENGIVAKGSAAISAAGDTLTVTQSSRRAVIDWGGFDINAGETTQFITPDASSMTLNRINSGDPSKIYGTLTSTGKLYLVNPNGLIFGQGAKVDTAGILATTANIRDRDFMRGRMNFNIAGNPGAAIVNSGSISARDAGLVGLVAPQVLNSGVITAKLGRAVLASGDTLTMDMYGDNLVSVAVTNEAAEHLAFNNGIIAADGGTVLMTAAAGRSVANGIVSNSGVIQANTFGEKNGKITLYAEGVNAVRGNSTAKKGQKSGGSAAYNTGVIESAGTQSGETGGDIVLAGDSVALAGNSVVNASGMAGGGDIRIGGAYLGGGDTPASLATYVGADAKIYNDAIENGDGGRTTVWSDGITGFFGSIFGRGGAAGGNGGFAETSGHAQLDVAGTVDLTAANGEKGLYFLDPANITVYGNVDPAFVSTDGTIDLATSLVLWLDPADRSKVTLTYDNAGLGGATASGTIGTTTITTSASIASNIAAGARIRLGGAGTAATASTLGTDTYTVVSVSGTTITVAETLTASYSGSAVYRGLASGWADKSGRGNNASSSGTIMPLWVGGGQNGRDVLRFDGVNDYMTIADADSLDATSALSIFATNTPFALDGTNPYPILSKRNSNDVVDAYSLFYYTGRKMAVDIDNTNNRFFSNTVYVPGTTNIVGVVYDGSLASATRVSYYDLGALDRTAAENSASIPNYSSNLYIGALDPARGVYLNGDYEDMMIYRAALGADARALLDQYQSAKWNVALNAPGTGATEGAKATSATGYSVFTTRYLERLSQTANVSLQATNNITLDLKGDTLNFTTAGRSLTLTAGGAVAATSAGAIATNNGAVTMTAGTTLDTSKININAGTAAISLTSAGAMTLGGLSGGTITARSTGATADLTIAAGKALAASSAGTALTLAAGRNFSNAGTLSTPSGRFVVYSKNPASDSLGGLTATFRRFSCTYGGSCPALPSTGNGFLYSYTPQLTATPDAIGLTYGDAAPALTGYAYTLSGYLGSDAAADSVTGSLNGTTGYAQFSNTGSYDINYASGSLASAMGYSILYANRANGISVAAAPLTISALGVTKTYGDLYSFGASDYSVTGLLNTDSVSSVTLASAGAAATANVGSYAITAGSAAGTGLSNYTITYNGATMDVDPATLTITAHDAGKTYGSAHVFGIDYDVAGLKNTDSVSSVTLASAGAAATANVGSYAITAGSAAGTGLSNYTIGYADGALTVTPAALTIRASDATKPFGNTLVFAGTEFTVSGLKNSDSVTSATLRSYGRLQTTAPGSYRIEASNAAGSGLGNYDITYVDGRLTVSPSAISMALDTRVNADYTPPEVMAGYSSGPRHAIIQISEPLAEQLGIDAQSRDMYSMTGQ